MNFSNKNNILLPSFFENSYSMMLLVDPENAKIIEANKAACRFYGYSHEQLTKMYVKQLNILSEEEIKAELISAKQGLENHFIFEHKLASGEIKDVEIYSSEILYQNKSVLLSIIHDITELKEQERENIKARFSLNEAERIAKIGHWEFDLTKNVVKASYGARKIYGLGLNNEELSVSQAQTIPLAEYRRKMDKALIDLIERKKPYDIEFKIKQQSTGKIRIIHSVAEYMPEKNTVFGVLRDITEQKQIEQNLIEQIEEYASLNEEYKEKNEEYATLNEEYKAQNDELLKAKDKAEESDLLKTEFLSNMSHEIRTPMNGILGFSSFLNKQGLTEEKRKYYIKIIQNSGHQLIRILDDIIEISRLGTKQVITIDEKICLNDLLLKQFSIFDIKAKENKIPLYLKKGLSDKESTILIDATKLNKILSNLLENALKFTKEGFIELGYTLVKMHGHGSQLEIYVKDTGIGIKKESVEIIFKRFSQEEKEMSQKVGGLGLGLSIAKENTELLGGSIRLESEKGKGSIFFIRIPYKPAKVVVEKKESEPKPVQKKVIENTILIVEDEEVNFLYLDTLLEDFELNLKRIHAKHGKEALDICRKNSEIKFVLMDMKMPVMNGFVATKLIKEFRPKLPIIAQTAYSTYEEKEQAFLAGCDDFISKPISEQVLSEIIKKYLPLL